MKMLPKKTIQKAQFLFFFDNNIQLTAIDNNTMLFSNFIIETVGNTIFDKDA